MCSEVLVLDGVLVVSGLSDRGDTGDSSLLLSRYSSNNLHTHTQQGADVNFPHAQWNTLARLFFRYPLCVVSITKLRSGLLRPDSSFDAGALFLLSLCDSPRFSCWSQTNKHARAGVYCEECALMVSNAEAIEIPTVHLSFPLAVFGSRLWDQHMLHLALAVVGWGRTGGRWGLLHRGACGALWNSSQKAEVYLHHQVPETSLGKRWRVVTSPKRNQRVEFSFPLTTLALVGFNQAGSSGMCRLCPVSYAASTSREPLRRTGVCWNFSYCSLVFWFRIWTCRGRSWGGRFLRRVGTGQLKRRVSRALTPSPLVRPLLLLWLVLQATRLFVVGWAPLTSLLLVTPTVLYSVARPLYHHHVPLLPLLVFLCWTLDPRSSP